MRYFLAFIFILGLSGGETKGWAQSPVSSGKVIFAEIQQLPKGWHYDLDSAWRVWDENSYYLWGANPRNYSKRDPSQKLKGSGLASRKGPTRGRGHPHYIGIITTSLEFDKNDRVFKDLEAKLLSGANIVIPLISSRFGLGTNAAFRRHSKIRNWYISQKYLFEKILYLSGLASEIVAPEGAFWPDCGLTRQSESPVNFAILTIEDLNNILPYLDSKIGS